MTWTYDKDTRTLQEFGLCAELDADNQGIVMTTCTQDTRQKWTIEDAADGHRLKPLAMPDNCFTSVKVQGPVVGLDPGVDVQAGLAKPCGQAPAAEVQAFDEEQVFQLSPSGGKSFPDGFSIQTGTSANANCALPVGADTVNFDAVAFETPTGDIVVVAMNMGEKELSFEIYDKDSQSGAKDITLPPHGIASYTLTQGQKDYILPPFFM